MKIVVLKELFPNEMRVAMTPQVVKKLISLGAEIFIEKGLGEKIFFPDTIYRENGAHIFIDSTKILPQADLVLRLGSPSREEIALMKKQAIYISFLDPFKEKKLIKKMLQAKLSTISMTMVPRSTIAQKMDALSSQANLAGYAAVLLAINHFNKILPMMTTPAGTLSPSKIFIIGVGVAGLQAIATSKRLGANVEAFDTRAEVEEQVKSLGAKFVKVDLGKTQTTKQGYAKALNKNQLHKQKKAMIQVLTKSDIVITAAQVFGKKTPRIIDDDMIKQMKPGSVIVDMAVESGGNVEGSRLDKIVEKHRVKIIGRSHLANQVSVDASQMYAMNLYNLISHFWDKENNLFKIDIDNDIMQSVLLTHLGELIHPLIKDLYAKE